MHEWKNNLNNNNNNNNDELWFGLHLPIYILLSCPEIETIKTHQVSVGHLFVVKCKIISTNVTWSREGAPNQSLPAGVEARDALLWFLPVQMAHNGTYTCEKK